ncbi:MAG: succinylglutamate desuccinylase/aspartoacylase family protein, partial [Proteobacteria bacterium]|nr:succinylglutamate desuccinylase/aspartoacylase family protein [Pseudomonadota bacterium]
MNLSSPNNTRKIETVQLPSASPGTSRQLDFIHYGVAGKGAKAYLQAALHADEIPGLLVIHKLIRLLNLADEKGEISGHIVLAPIANPIGNSQHFLGELAGRYDFFN